VAVIISLAKAKEVYKTSKSKKIGGNLNGFFGDCQKKIFGSQLSTQKGGKGEIVKNFRSRESSTHCSEQTAPPIDCCSRGRRFSENKESSQYLWSSLGYYRMWRQ
jgi:hypothetical protein